MNWSPKCSQRDLAQALKLSAIFLAVFIAGIVMLAASTLQGSNSELWAGWAQFFGSMIAVAVAILVPFLQRAIERRDDRIIRNISAAAFTLTLLPKVVDVLAGVELAMKDIDQAFAISPEASQYSTFAEFFTALTFLSDNWRELNNFEPYIARRLIAAIGAIKAADRLIDHDNVWPNDLGPDAVQFDVPFFDHVSLGAHRKHYEHARQLLGSLIPILESFIENSSTEEHSAEQARISLT